MKVKNLKINNFRNIKHLNIDFDEKINVISGENAQGKTNILESIWLFCGAKSFRNSKESSFIKIGETQAKTEIDFNSFEILHNAKMEFSDKRTVLLDNKALKSPSELAGNFSAVVFSPADLSLVREGPDKRRKFLDVCIGQIYPNYIDILRDYKRAVMQRNNIIKEYKYDGTISIMLDVFEEEIASKGIKIIEYRQKFLNFLNRYIDEIYYGISSGKEKIKSVYVANTDANMLKEELERSRKDDSFYGYTSAGPHRDDIELIINGTSARVYGSQGQQRSVAIALKLGSLNVFKEISGEYPVCLLDDVMSELDEQRQKYILNHIREWQTFITCCDPSNVNRLVSGKVFNIRNGEVI